MSSEIFSFPSFNSMGSTERNMMQLYDIIEHTIIITNYDIIYKPLSTKYKYRVVQLKSKIYNSLFPYMRKYWLRIVYGIDEYWSERQRAFLSK